MQGDFVDSKATGCLQENADDQWRTESSRADHGDAHTWTVPGAGRDTQPVPVPIVLDCDVGHDDAIAILLALASPEVELLAVTAVSGNAPLHHTFANAIRVLDHVGRPDIPVAAGADRPLIADPFTPGDVHGASGMDGPELPPPSRLPEGHAIDLMAETVERSSDPVTLIATGPLTNVALFLARYPELAERLAAIVLMGGSIGYGNVTPNAEFNIWADPEAARRVFTSGLDVTMVGLDVTHEALMTPADAGRMREAGRAGRLIAELVDFYARSHPGWTGTPVHDAVAVAAVVDPGLLRFERCAIDVDCGPVCRGRTICDLGGRGALPATCRVATAIQPGFGEWLATRIERLR
jgi:inosine-uridine nucleoside N-ribohydrolase